MKIGSIPTVITDRRLPFPANVIVCWTVLLTNTPLRRITQEDDRHSQTQEHATLENPRLLGSHAELLPQENGVQGGDEGRGLTQHIATANTKKERRRNGVADLRCAQTEAVRSDRPAETSPHSYVLGKELARTRKDIAPFCVNQVADGRGLPNERVPHGDAIGERNQPGRLGEGKCGEGGEEGRESGYGVRIQAVRLFACDRRHGSPEGRHEGYESQRARMPTSDDADENQLPCT